MARWIALLRGVNIPAWAKRSVPCQEDSEIIKFFSVSSCALLATFYAARPSSCFSIGVSCGDRFICNV